ncbi:hypothetical protein CNMCM5793_001413 [Aspergillus hiratsukae]|uniref:Uncharacterized protein n=1 Tax=Aspergillus hiratsukae TaxID=1194566 RepID=A0A8H6Q2M5_9EURO|nr:hypothetical protein CNMCM5793_001413 [Aspergillus hiratsukae]KAF7164634.1 hypothetical protein CNMCM6106_001086 [Aspergillus hiratsukae]
MKAGIPLLFFSSTALAALAPDLCGPDSNCEIVNIKGNKAYRFKKDMGPGSEDYISRFGNETEQTQKLTARSADIITSVNMGKTDMGWGCDDIIIEDILQELHWLCLDGPENGMGACDEGSQHSMKVGWATRYTYTLADLTLSAEGTYPSWSKHLSTASALSLRLELSIPRIYGI